MKNDLMKYKGYRAKIHFDAEDNILVGEVIGLTDSLSFHGGSVDELNQMFAQCIDNYLQLCKDVGKNPEHEYKGSFNIRISPELHKKVALRAAEENETLNQYITHALEVAVG